RTGFPLLEEYVRRHWKRRDRQLRAATLDGDDMDRVSASRATELCNDLNEDTWTDGFQLAIQMDLEVDLEGRERRVFFYDVRLRSAFLWLDDEQTSRIDSCAGEQLRRRRAQHGLGSF